MALCLRPEDAEILPRQHLHCQRWCQTQLYKFLSDKILVYFSSISVQNIITFCSLPQALKGLLLVWSKAGKCYYLRVQWNDHCHLKHKTKPNLNKPFSGRLSSGWNSQHCHSNIKSPLQRHLSITFQSFLSPISQEIWTLLKHGLPKSQPRLPELQAPKVTSTAWSSSVSSSFSAHTLNQCGWFQIDS